jgi:hypothetical protein
MLVAFRAGRASIAIHQPSALSLLLRRQNWGPVGPQDSLRIVLLGAVVLVAVRRQDDEAAIQRDCAQLDAVGRSNL